MPRMPHLGLDPLVGEAMHQLGIGRTEEATVERLASLPKYSGFDLSAYRQAVARAASNLAALEAARQHGGAVPVTAATGGRIPSGEMTGFRIQAIGVTSTGSRERVGLTVNAPSTMSLAEVAAQVNAARAQGGLMRRFPQGSPEDLLEVTAMDVFAIVEGGMDNPALTIQGPPSAEEASRTWQDLAHQLGVDVSGVPEGLTAEEWANIQVHIRYPDL